MSKRSTTISGGGDVHATPAPIHPGSKSSNKAGGNDIPLGSQADSPLLEEYIDLATRGTVSPHVSIHMPHPLEELKVG
jgi:hypothetical protein